jgi:hypothetical protein
VVLKALSPGDSKTVLYPAGRIQKANNVVVWDANKWKGTKGIALVHPPL